MTKTIIPFSGGVNSAYGLYRFLTETDDEILAVRFEQTFNDSEKEKEEERKASEIIKWFQNNCREFTYIVETPESEYKSDLRPIRKGFNAKSDYGQIIFRHKEYSRLCRKYKADRLVLGNSVENTATDRFPELYHMLPEEVEVYFCSTPKIEALPAFNQLDFDQLASVLSGRFEQLYKLPEALREKVRLCSEDHDITRYPLCWACISRKVDERLVASGLTHRETDEFFAKTGHYGRYRSAADPETYNWRGTGPVEGLRFLGIDIETIEN